MPTTLLAFLTAILSGLALLFLLGGAVIFYCADGMLGLTFIPAEIFGAIFAASSYGAWQDLVLRSSIPLLAGAATLTAVLAIPIIRWMIRAIQEERQLSRDSWPSRRY